MAKIPDPVSWFEIEDALFDWVADQSEMDVVWGNQDAPAPKTYPYCTLTVLSGPRLPAAYGHDELRTSTIANQPLGEELLLEFGGQREFTLSINIFDAPPSSLGVSHPRFVMSRIQASLAAPSVLGKLSASGIAVIDYGDIVILDAAVDDTWIARCSMDVVLGIAVTSFEKIGYIKTVLVSSPEPISITDRPMGE